MVSKWVITVMTCLQMEYIGVITHLLTIDPGTSKKISECPKTRNGVQNCHMT